MLESALTRRVQARLKDYGVFAFKVAGGARQRAGISDLIGVLPDGKFLAIELKRPGKYWLPWDGCTELQKKFLQTVAKNGGRGFACDSVEDLERWLGAWGYEPVVDKPAANVEELDLIPASYLD